MCGGHHPFVRTLERTPELPLTLDLEQQTIVCGNRTYNFSIDSVRRMRLLNGWDDVALTQSYRDRISAFKAQNRIQRPWAHGRMKAAKRQATRPHLAARRATREAYRA